jgi:hypothetical protein
MAHREQDADIAAPLLFDPYQGRKHDKADGRGEGVEGQTWARKEQQLITMFGR